MVQIAEDKADSAEQLLKEAGVKFHLIGEPSDERTVMIEHQGTVRMIGIDHMRDVWMRPSYLLDCLQSDEKCARMRFENYKKQPLRYRIPSAFNGSLESRGL